MERKAITPMNRKKRARQCMAQSSEIMAMKMA
jgi:hypothetical protein